MAEVVRLVFGAGTSNQVRHKIAFRHRDIRDAVEAAGAKGILDLLHDSGAGWCYLVQHGRRQFDPKITKDGASDLIDAWLADNDENDMDKLGMLLMQALENSKFLKFPKAASDAKTGDEEAVPEGNAQTQTTTDP
jgi:hypothetical protein